jgi:hypothetical protein
MSIPNIKYKFMEKIYDINSNLMIYNNRVDTSEFILDISLRDLSKISIICLLYIVSMTFIYGWNEAVFDFKEFIICTLGYSLILIMCLFYKHALERRDIHINSYKNVHKRIIMFVIEMATLTNLIFLTLKGYDNLLVIRSCYFEFFFNFFLTVLLKLEDSGYCIIWIINVVLTTWIETRLHVGEGVDTALTFEKVTCIMMCICSIVINRDSQKKIIKNYIIHKKTQRYIDHLISKMFCLFFAFNDNKFVYINKIAKNFINNRYDNNEQESDYDTNYDLLSKGK